MGEHDRLKRKTLASLAWKVFERGGSVITNMLVQIVMARLLTPEDFGALAIMLVFINFGNILIISGLNTALVQAPGVTNEDYTTVFWMSFTLSAIVYAVVFVGAPAVASFYELPSLVWPLRALGLNYLINAYNSVQLAKITRDLELRKTFNATMVSVVVSGVVGCASALAGAGLWALVLQQIIYQVSNCIVHALQVDWFPCLKFNPVRARSLFSFGWKLLVSSLLDSVQQSLSDLIIGKQFSSAQLGLVNQGKKYPNAAGSVLDSAIQSVMLSVFSHVQDDIERVKRLLRRSLQVSCFLIFPSMCLLAVTAHQIVPFVLGEQWVGAVPFFQMYCVFYALYPIHSSCLQAINGVGRSDLYLKLALVKKGIGIAWIIVASIMFRDVYVLVLGSVVIGFVSLLVNLSPNKGILGYSWSEQAHDILPPLALTAAAAVVSSGVVISLGVAGLLAFLLECIVFISFFLIGSYLFKLEVIEYMIQLARDLICHR